MEGNRDLLEQLWKTLGDALGFRAIKADLHDALLAKGIVGVDTLSDKLRGGDMEGLAKLKAKLEECGIDPDDIPDLSDYDLPEIKEAYEAKEKLERIGDRLDTAFSAIEDAQSEL